MSQVSGRAGRTKKRGNVIIQTSQPDHPIIRDVVRHDYDHMFRDQLKERKSFHYPPYSRLIRISLKHYNSDKLDEASRELAHRLRTVLDKRVLGPEAPIVNRIQRKFIKVILIKIEKSKQSTQLKGLVIDSIREFEKDNSYRSVQIIVDVDPM
jgi:primosomal protein N' (replication factor Y)